MRTRKEGIEIVKLRGHHLICLHFYNGEGYDKKFRSGLRLLVDKTRDGAPVLAVSGPDDVCNKCPYLKEKRCASSENSDSEISEMDSAALGLLAISPGAELKWDEIYKKLPDIFPVWSRSFCTACGWKKACLKSPLYKLLAI